VNRDVHSGQARCASVTRASRFLIGLVTCFATHDGIPPSHPPPGPDRCWAVHDQLRETAAESAQRRAADREAHLGDAEVATTQQCHRTLDATGHQ